MWQSAVERPAKSGKICTARVHQHKWHHSSMAAHIVNDYFLPLHHFFVSVVFVKCKYSFVFFFFFKCASTVEYAALVSCEVHRLSIKHLFAMSVHPASNLQWHHLAHCIVFIFFLFYGQWQQALMGITAIYYVNAKTERNINHIGDAGLFTQCCRVWSIITMISISKFQI